MRHFNVFAFDELISGTAKVWYSSGELNATLADAHVLALHACSTNVSGTSPTLTVTLEHSADNQDWSPVAATPEVVAAALAENGSAFGFRVGAFSGYVRAKIALGGTAPQCRLKLYVTGRLWGAQDEEERRAIF